ncbi:MAG: 2-hydroxychromene-2-carboxylate isomerase [Polaromonas sp.]|nr:2-hydroxychromene-2-carboxylate isomerase [Polaromonas sp.]
MAAAVDYFFSVASPWSFLGSARFIDLAARSGAVVRVRPMDFSQVLAATGGLPYQQRSPQRASYRQEDLARWRTRLGVPLQLEPRFYPVDRTPASLLVIAARTHGQQAVLRLSHAILQAIWQENRNIADWVVLKAIAHEAGLDGHNLAAEAQAPGVAEAYRQDTADAITAGVFGAPTWIVDGERFWGQDRLEFLEARLLQNPSPQLACAGQG